MKKTIVALLVATSPLTFAGAMGSSCDSSNVKTPCAANAWQLGGQALYLQTNAPISQSNSGVTTLNGQNINFEQPWNWGFRIEAAYRYSKANDVNVNWSHINQSSQRTSTGPFVVDQLYTHPTGDSVSLTNNPTWDNVNIEVGQHLILNDNKMARFHGGVEYVRITSTNTRTINSTSSSSFYNDTRKESYNGFGPRIGVDFNYSVNQSINFYVNTAAGLLAGQGNSTLNDANTSLGLTTTTSGSNSMTVVVPELEGKLGVQYNYALAQGNLIADAGWLWINYFNGQSTYVIGQQNVTPQDFSLQGLYFGLKWQGDLY